MSLKKDVNIHFGRGDYFYKLNNFKPKIENLQHVYVFFSNLDLFYFKIKFMILNITTTITWNINIKQALEALNKQPWTSNGNIK